MKKSILAIFLMFLITVTLFSVPASAYQISGFEITAEGAMLVSLDETGDVLYSKNADKKLYPASLTKIMTALLVIENSSDLDGEIITVNESSVRALDGTGAAVAGLKDGEQLTARQAIYMLLVSSYNDCAMAVAEHYGGTVSGFVGMMNKRAKELGMTGTHFANPHGLHDSEHYTTVNDMYRLVKHALSFEDFKEAVCTTRYKMPATNKNPARTLVTTIYLQDRHNSVSPNYFYKYAGGVKTGFTDEAGRCLITTASKGGYNYLCILMNCPAYDSAGNLIRVEFGEAQALFEWAFNNFEFKTVVDSGTPVAEAKVELCWEHDYVPLLIEGGLSAILPKDADSSTVQIRTKPTSESFDAPIKKGDIMGTADIYYAEEKLGEVNLIAGDSRSANFVLRVARFFKTALTSTAFKIALVVVVLAIVVFIVAVILMNRNRKKRRRSRKYKGYSKYN